MSAFRVEIISEWVLVFEGASPTARGSGVTIMRSSGRWGEREKTVGSTPIIGHGAYS